jgi:hypothetical protein
VTLAAISCLLIACVGASPVPIDGAFSELAFEALPEVVEDGELVLAEHVRVRVGVQVVADFGDGLVEVGGDTWVEIAFGVAGNVDGSLVGQLAFVQLLFVLPPIAGEETETETEWRRCKSSGEDEARDGGLG